MPWCALGDPLPYIPGSCHKTIFIIEIEIEILY
jgi:hypothetical protein